MVLKQEIITDDKEHQKALAKAQADVAKLTVKYEELKNKTKEGAREGRRVQEQQKQSTLDQALALGKVVVGLQAVQMATGFVRTAYQDWRKDMERLAAESKKLNDSIVRDLTLAGDLARGGELTQFFATSPVATPEQRAGAYFGVRQAAPFQTVERTRRLTESAERVAGLGQDTRSFGALVGELADALPTTPAADVADLALAIQQRAGDQAGKLADPNFQRAVSLLRQSGFGAEEALALGLKALDANINLKTLEQYAIQGKDKMAAALQAKIGLVDFAGAEQLAGQLRTDVAGDYLGRQLAAAGRFPAGAELQAAQGTEAALQRAELEREFRARSVERARREMYRIQEEAGTGWLQRALERAAFETSALAGDVTGAELPGVSGLRGTFQVGSPKGRQAERFVAREQQLLADMLAELKAIRAEQAKEGTQRGAAAGADVNRHVDSR